MTISGAASKPAGDGDSARKIKPGGAVLLGVLVVLVGSGFGLWALPANTSLFKTAPIQVLLGSSVFISLIALIVVVFARLGLYDRSAPLALPEGSVRALIALILLIIFIIFANVIFGQLSSDTVSQPATFTGLSQAQVMNLPGQIESEHVMTSVVGQPQQFEGTYRISTPSQDAANLGQQVVTGLLTLVAAISAFYFGSGSVAAGVKAINQVGKQIGGTATLLLLRPSMPVALTPKVTGGYEDLEIELGGNALDTAGVQAMISKNDPGGKIRRGASDASFVYSPSPSPTDPVTLHFDPMAPGSDGKGIDLLVNVSTPTEPQPAADTGPDQPGAAAVGPDHPRAAAVGADQPEAAGAGAVEGDPGDHPPA